MSKAFFLLSCFFFFLNVSLGSANQFGLQGEFLYLRPTSTGANFAAELVELTFTDFTVKSLFNENRYKPAYRIEGFIALSCLDSLRGRVTYLNSNRNPRRVQGDFISPASFTGTVEDNNKFLYYAAELLYTRKLYQCSFDVEIEAGLLYSNIKYREFTKLTDPTSSDMRQVHSNFKGLGPELVFHLNYPLPLFRAFVFEADARAALLACKTDLFSTGPFGFTNLNEPLRGIVPSSDMKLGARWNWYSTCFKLNISAGYEWIFYHRAFGVGNISFRGPFFALGMAF